MPASRLCPPDPTYGACGAFSSGRRRRDGSGRQHTTDAGRDACAAGGSHHFEGVEVSAEEMDGLRRIYGIEAVDSGDPCAPLLQAAADRAAFRLAQRDGLRIVAWLARESEEGDDPLRAVVRLAAANGWDMPGDDEEWAWRDDE